MSKEHALEQADDKSNVIVAYETALHTDHAFWKFWTKLCKLYNVKEEKARTVDISRTLMRRLMEDQD